MKKVLFLLLLSHYSIAQVIDEQSQTVCFPKYQVINIYNNVRELERQNVLKDTLMSLYQLQINNYKILSVKDSVTISYKDIQIKSLQKEIDLRVEYQKQTKSKWHDNKLLWFGVGFVTCIFPIIYLK
jgi:hypothetical protein